MQSDICSRLFLKGDIMKEKKKRKREIIRSPRIVVERKYVGKEDMTKVFRNIAEEELQNKANKFVETA